MARAVSSASRGYRKKLYDDQFFRAWEFCLSCSEMAFRKQGAVSVQIQMAKHQGVVPITRDYIGREEARLRSIETSGTPFAQGPRRINMSEGRWEMVSSAPAPSAARR